MDTKEIFALQSIPGLGAKSLLNIINSGQSFSELTASSAEELKQYIKGNKAKQVIEALQVDPDYFLEEADNSIRNLEHHGISLITYEDELYPPFLKLIKDWPVFIYAKGNLELLKEQSSLAIVGTRECSPTGSKVARSMAKKFASMGINIVSGLAAGIDTAAHEGALEANGTTTAVLVDVDHIFPRENEELARRIIDNNGLLIAENPPGVKMVGALFTRRDRLQSALSLGVIPVETDVKGGTMHTVRYAKEQNRNLYCPDIRRVSTYSRTQKEVRGIWELIDTGKAVPISESDYRQIVESELPAKVEELLKEIEDDQIQQELFN